MPGIGHWPPSSHQHHERRGARRDRVNGRGSGIPAIRTGVCDIDDRIFWCFLVCFLVALRFFVAASASVLPSSPRTDCHGDCPVVDMFCKVFERCFVRCFVRCLKGVL